VQAVGASSLKPSHSRQRKLRLRIEEDWWDTTAKEILDLFSTSDTDRVAINDIRKTLYKKSSWIIIAPLADRTEIGFAPFATALAVVIHEVSKHAAPIRVAKEKLEFEKPVHNLVHKLAANLETRTHNVSHKWTQHEVLTIEANMFEFLSWYWLN